MILYSYFVWDWTFERKLTWCGRFFFLILELLRTTERNEFFFHHWIDSEPHPSTAYWFREKPNSVFYALYCALFSRFFCFSLASPFRRSVTNVPFPKYIYLLIPMIKLLAWANFARIFLATTRACSVNSS